MDETFTDEELNGIISDVSKLIMHIHGDASFIKGRDPLGPTLAPNNMMYDNLYALYWSWSHRLIFPQAKDTMSQQLISFANTSSMQTNN